MKVMIDIPKEFEEDLKDNFQDFCSRVIEDIDYALDNQEPLLCGNYERETAEMFLSAFEKATIIPDNATNGDMIKAMFPKCKEVGISGIGNIKSIAVDIGLGTSYFSFDWWNVPYKKEVEE